MTHPSAGFDTFGKLPGILQKIRILDCSNLSILYQQLTTLWMWLLDGQTHSCVWTDQNHCEFSIDVTFQVRKRLKRWYQSNLKLLKFKFCTGGEEWNLLATSTVHTEFLVTVRFSLATTERWRWELILADLWWSP